MEAQLRHSRTNEMHFIGEGAKARRWGLNPDGAPVMLLT
jgi:hypothetical protein